MRYARSVALRGLPGCEALSPCHFTSLGFRFLLCKMGGCVCGGDYLMLCYEDLMN